MPLLRGIAGALAGRPPDTLTAADWLTAACVAAMVTGIVAAAVYAAVAV